MLIYALSVDYLSIIYYYICSVPEKKVMIFMLRKIVIVFASLLFTVASVADTQKTDVLGLYAADVAVKDRSDAQWQLGVKSALRKVLVKVSGNASVNTLNDIIRIADANHLAVQQFSYENILPDDASANPKNKIILKVNFDIDMINNILQQTGQAIWDTARPQTIIWFITDKDGKNAFLTDQDAESEFFFSIANARGIKVLLPLHDLQYNTLLDFDFSSQELLKNIRGISSKYPVEQILLGKKSVNSDEIYWKLITSDAEYVWTDTEKDLKRAVDSAVYHVVDGMVARNSFFQDKSMEASAVMSVDNIDSLETYQSLVGFLNRCPVVSSFHVDSVAKNKVFLVVAAKGGGEALVDYFSKNKLMKLVSDPGAYDDVEMAYEWLDKS